MRRLLPALAALALVATACAQQAPERTPLPPLPEELAFPEVTEAPGGVATSTTTAVPEVCTLNYGQGAVVLSADPAFPAAEVLAAGDLITTIDDQPVTSADSLVVALVGRQPGEVVNVRFVRDDAVQLEEVALGASPTNPTIGRLGVSLGTTIDSFETTSLPDVDTPDRALLVALESEVYYLDPTGPTWAQLPIPAPSGNVIWINSDLYGFQLGATELISLVSGETIPLPLNGKTVIQVLGALGPSVIISAGDNDEGRLSNTEILSINLDGEVVNWTLALPDLSGEPVIPAIGWAAGDGSRIAVTSITESQRLHSLISADGEILAGYGVPNQPFIRSDALLGGWIDSDRLTYVYPETETGLTVGIRDTSSTEEDTRLDLGDINQVRQMWTLPLSDRAIIATPTDSHLISLTTGNTIYRMSQGCAPFVISATVG